MFSKKNVTTTDTVKPLSAIAIVGSFFSIGPYDRKEADKAYQESNSRLDAELLRSQKAIQKAQALIEKVDQTSPIQTVPGKS